MMWIGAALTAVGIGMLTTLQPGSPIREWVGYRVRTSIGFGMAIQVPYTIVQVVFKTADVRVGNALLLFCMCLGGSLAVSNGQNIFSSVLLRELRKSPGFSDSADLVLDVGVIELGNLLPEPLVGQLVDLYSKAITATLILPIAAAGITFVTIMGLERQKLNISKNT
jgi:hypothetical protein